MPGEIGASMFSPRPGRGYRFHSLQVEIIARTFAVSEMRQFWSIEPANEQRLCWNLNALLQKIGDGNHGEITISWMVKPVTDGGDRPPRIVATCCSSVSPIPPLPTRLPSRDRDIGGGVAQPLAGSHAREEDRSTSIKTKL